MVESGDRECRTVDWYYQLCPKKFIDNDVEKTTTRVQLPILFEQGGGHEGADHRDGRGAVGQRARDGLQLL